LEILRATQLLLNQNATGINTLQSSSPQKEADQKYGPVAHLILDSPINFAVMKRLKLKYGLLKLELL
jgi:hypothetical protein